MNADQDRNILWAQQLLELVETTKLVANVLYTRCSQGENRRHQDLWYQAITEKGKEIGGTDLSWWPSPGHRMLRTLHSSYRMQSILTESTETFLCSLFQAGEAAPALVSAAKERKYTCQTFLREFVRMEVMLAEIHHVHPLHYQNQRILAPWSLEPQLASFDQSIWYQHLDMQILLCLPMKCKEGTVQVSNTKHSVSWSQRIPKMLEHLNTNPGMANMVHLNISSWWNGMADSLWDNWRRCQLKQNIQYWCLQKLMVPNVL